MSAEKIDKQPPKGKRSKNVAIYAIAAVGVLYLVLRLVLHFSQAE
jgi:hypothetical protein